MTHVIKTPTTTVTTTQVTESQSSNEVKPRSTILKRIQAKANKDSSKSKVVTDKAKANAKKQVKANLVEEVISNRTVKYKYPKDCLDPISRKTYRQTVRGHIKKFTKELFERADQNSKEYTAKLKEFEAYKAQHLKPNAAA